MNFEDLNGLRDCCKDEAAFQKLRQILAIAETERQHHHQRNPGLFSVGAESQTRSIPSTSTTIAAGPEFSLSADNRQGASDRPQPNEPCQQITQRNWLEPPLKPSEPCFQALIEHATDIIVILDEQGNFCYCSPSAERILGYRLDDVVGHHALEFVDPDDAPLILQTLQAAIQNPSVSQPMVEYRVLHKNGSWRIFEAMTTSLLDDPTVRGVVVNCRDITEDIIERQKAEAKRQSAEAALRESEERLRLTLEATQIGTWDFDYQTRTLTWSESCERLFGLQSGTHDGTIESFFALVHPSDRPAVIQAVDHASRSQGDHAKEFRIVRPDSCIRWISERSHTFCDDTGKPQRLVGISMDITPTKQTQESLQQQAERERLVGAVLEHQVRERATELEQALQFEAMLKRITEAVRDSLDEDTILQTAVQELTLGLEVFGCDAALYNLQERTSTICYEYVRIGLKPAVGWTFNLDDQPESYTHLFQGDHFQFCRNVISPIRPLKYQHTALACPMVDDQGAIGDLWLFKPCKEIFTPSEIRLVEQVANQCAIAVRQARLYQAAQAQVAALEELNQLKDDFLSTVSHELRTPMSNMKMAIHMLRTATNLDRQQRYLDILQAECQREIELINDLLDLQRLEAASYQVSVDLISLTPFLVNLLEPFYSRTQNRQQALQINLPAISPTLTTDKAMLERALVELLNNACKYTPPQGEIGLDVHITELSSEAAEPLWQIVFEVSNQAEISALELPRIFDRFYRIPHSDRWKQGGTGLGLALVQHLITQLGGTINVRSQAGWTTFTIQLSTPSCALTRG